MNTTELRKILKPLNFVEPKVIKRPKVGTKYGRRKKPNKKIDDKIIYLI